MSDFNLGLQIFKYIGLVLTMFSLLHLLDYIFKDISSQKLDYMMIWLFTGVAFFINTFDMEQKEVEVDEKYEGPPDECQWTIDEGDCPDPENCHECHIHNKYWEQVGKRKPPTRVETKSDFVRGLIYLGIYSR